MYQPSDRFIEELNKENRTFLARITSGTDVLREEIKSIIFTIGSCGADTFTIGSVFASYIEMNLSATDVSLAGREFLVEIGLLFPDETIEYIPMGYYTISPSDISKTRDLITIKATDRIASKCSGLYVPTMTFPCSVQAVLDDIEAQAGITIETSLDTSGIIQTAMTGLLYREVLGYIAGLLGGFCYADRNGNIQIASYPDKASLEVESERFWEIIVAEDAYSVGSLTVVVSDGGEDADGNQVEGVAYTEGTGTGITVSNPYMTESMFSAMKGKVVGYSYRPGTARFLGDPRLDPSDAIKAVNYAGEEFIFPCMSLVQEYDGGLTTTITTPSQTISDNGVKGPLTQQVER